MNPHKTLVAGLVIIGFFFVYRFWQYHSTPSSVVKPPAAPGSGGSGSTTGSGTTIDLKTKAQQSGF